MKIEKKKPTEKRKEESILLIGKMLEEYMKKALSENRLPLILTNEDLKREFQISDSTLNRLIKLSDFPECWYGIRGHYYRDEVLKWVDRNDAQLFQSKMKELRSL